MSARWNLADIAKKSPAIQAQITAQLHPVEPERTPVYTPIEPVPEIDRPWTNEQVGALVAAYSKPETLDIAALAASLGRTKAAVACKAGEIGVSFSRGKYARGEATKALLKVVRKEQMSRPGAKEAASKAAKEWHSKNPHPRGMLGKKHSQKSKDAMSAGLSGLPVPPERTLRQMKTRLARHGTLAPPRAGCSWKQGWREISGRKIFFRSRWEFNYGLYLELLKTSNAILGWEHEPETFWFEKIRRGCRSYLPDFRITNPDGSVEYHEVKGWMDARSKTKIKRMAKYHPSVKLRLIEASWFKLNAPRLRGLIPQWER